MNLEQIKPENIKEILNQIRLSIESDLTNKSIYKEENNGKSFYKFDIYPDAGKKTSFSYDEIFKFDILISKNESKFFFVNNSTYEITLEIRRKSYSNNWNPYDEIKLSQKQYFEELSKIYELIHNEYIRKDIESKNKKINDYIGLIKTTVKPEVKRDVSIDEILN